MSQFVHVENQNLLWRMAHKIPEFDNMSSVQRSSLFKQTIEQVYDSITTKEITQEQLNTYNRSILSQLVRQLRAPPPGTSRPPLPPLKPIIQQQPQQPQQPQPQQPQTFVESKEELFQRQFQAKQQEYETMNAKPDIPDAAELFKEKMDDDGRIENMDELIKQYETQRKQDMNEVMSQMNPVTNATIPATTEIDSSSNVVDHLEDKQEIMEMIKELDRRISLLETKREPEPEPEPEREPEPTNDSGS